MTSLCDVWAISVAFRMQKLLKLKWNLEGMNTEYIKLKGKFWWGTEKSVLKVICLPLVNKSIEGSFIFHLVSSLTTKFREIVPNKALAQSTN